MITIIFIILVTRWHAGKALCLFSAPSTSFSPHKEKISTLTHRYPHSVQLMDAFLWLKQQKCIKKNNTTDISQLHNQFSTLKNDPLVFDKSSAFFFSFGFLFVMK